MKPIFTIHAGEFLVGSHLEQKFGKKINVWIPSKDTGVDFLLTDSSNQKTTSIQGLCCVIVNPRRIGAKMQNKILR
ncbi:hypothetical protein ACFXAP_003729 [Vibrio cholerae]